MIKEEDIKRVKAEGFLWNKGTENFSARIITVNGKISSDQQKHIGEAAERFGNGEVTFTTRLTIEIPGVPFEKTEELKEFLSLSGLETGGTGSKVRPVVSCKGTTCHYGLTDTFDLSEKIHRKFYEGYGKVKLPHKFKIAVGGCPNNCVKPDLNDAGIIVQRIPRFDEDKCRNCSTCTVEKICPADAVNITEGKITLDEDKCINCGRCIGKCAFHVSDDYTDGYKVYIGGMWGKSPRKGDEISRIFSSEEECLDFIENIILYFKDKGIPGERFGRTIDRIGKEKAEEELLSEISLKEKNRILNKEVKGKGATF